MLPLMVQLNYIFTPQTQMSSPLLWRYPELCENTLFVTRRGQHHRIIELKPIAETLGPEKTAALPAFHALSGADNTGSFSGKGKLLCWKIFADADSSIITALAELGQAAHPNEEIVAVIEKFVWLPYQPRTKMMTVKELRWSLLKKKQAQSNRLPPTQAALLRQSWEPITSWWSGTATEKQTQSYHHRSTMDGGWTKKNGYPSWQTCHQPLKRYFK